MLSIELTFNIIQVKKVMNTVYRRLRSEFSPDVEYKSSEIDSIVLSVIKVNTQTQTHADVHVVFVLPRSCLVNCN